MSLFSPVALHHFRQLMQLRKNEVNVLRSENHFASDGCSSHLFLMETYIVQQKVPILDLNTVTLKERRRLSSRL